MQDYQAFRNTPVIASLAGKPIWTVSDQNKRPIDMFELQAHNHIQGAITRDWLSLETLDNVTRLLPNAKNRTCYLNSAAENLMIFDIEPTCPPELRDKFLRFPCDYAEWSMSGKGIHMIMPVPWDLLESYPAARNKLALRHPSGWYEFLLNHYVTFTGNQIPHTGTDQNGFLTVFENLAKIQSLERPHENIDNPTMEQGRIYESDPMVEKILDMLTSGRQPYNKTLADFNNDHSRYEFALIANRYVWLQRLMSDPNITHGEAFPDEKIIWILYRTAQILIPWRKKHDTYRRGMPWLMYQAATVYSMKKPAPPPPQD